MEEQKSELTNSASDLPKVIKDYSSIATTYIEQQDFENALEALTHNRDLLVNLEDQGHTIDSSLWVETFHNSALCLQRLGKLEDCVTCLEECLYYLKDKTPWEVKCHKHFLNTSKNYLEKITKSKYKCKINIQLCAILSQLNRHESALIHGKKAYERAQKAVIYCHEICKDHLSLHKRLMGYSKLKSQHSQYKLLDSPHYIYFTKLVQFANPVITSLAKYFDKDAFPDTLDKRSSLSSYIAEWLMGFQIGDMMIIDFLDFNELKSRTGIDDEISIDLLLEKICFLTISTYCIGTEIRMLSSQKFSKYVINDAKEHYYLSLKYAEFLPKSTLLYSHINITYAKYFGLDKVDKKPKEISFEKVRRKSKSPEIEKIYKPKSLKVIKHAITTKKGKGALSVAKMLNPLGQKKEQQGEVEAKDKPAVEFIVRNEPDPETNAD